MEPLFKKLTSRKFLGALIVVITVFLNQFGVTDMETEELYTLAGIVSAFVIGESALDRERIKATQMVNLQNAENSLQKLLADGNAIIGQKDAIIEDLERLLDDAAGGPDS